MTENNWQDDAKKIGDILKNRLNMQPAAIGEIDKEGVLRVGYVPPPTFSDLKLTDLGKQTQVY